MKSNLDLLKEAMQVGNIVLFLKQNLANELPFKDIRVEHQIENTKYLIKALCYVYPDGSWINESNEYLLKLVKRIINNKYFW